MVIDSPDTDVLMIGHFQKLSAATVFITRSGKTGRSTDIKSAHDIPGEKNSSPSINFQTFTGSDMSRKFADRSRN